MAAKQQRVFAFINETILDGTCDMEPQRGMSVLVDKGRIVRIEPAATAQLPAEAKVIDLHDSYLLPGLINMHVHFCGSGKPVSAGNAGDLMRRLDNAPGRMIVRHILKGSAQQQLASGVTCVRGAGDPLYADIAVRDAINAGRYLGPRIVTAVGAAEDFLGSEAWTDRKHAHAHALGNTLGILNQQMICQESRLGPCRRVSCRTLAYR